MTKILITGGAGFVGATLAIAFKTAYSDAEIISLDNLSRRGSELNLPRLLQHGVKFIHGDVRNPEDLAKLGSVDWLIECSAEPSVHAGYQESPAYLMNTNLLGLIHCLEYLRQQGGKLIFLSTSRVYPIPSLRTLPLRPEGLRFKLDETIWSEGVSLEGIAENFSLEGHRSLYGATKLCGEILIEEYRHMYGVQSVINRCGVLAGPWQMGKVDQGFMSLWVARHYFQHALQYMGFGGEGLQVRDVLHVQDLFTLLMLQMKQFSDHQGCVYNVGGGMKNSVSLAELTELVQAITGKQCAIHREPETRAADIPFYVTDITKVSKKTQWRPERSITHIVEDITAWLQQNETALKPLFQI